MRADQKGNPVFNSLLKLAGQTDFTMAIRATGPNKSLLSIVLMPVPKEGQDAALAQPVKLEGSVEELTAGFDDAIAKYGAARSSLIEQVDATVTILKQAEDESASKAADKLKGKPGKAGTAKPGVAAKAAPGAGSAGAKPAGDDDDVDPEPDDDDDKTSQTSSTGTAGAAPAATAQVQTGGESNNLFKF
jgi:PRTRC genetic system protein E